MKGVGNDPLKSKKMSFDYQISFPTPNGLNFGMKHG